MYGTLNPFFRVLKLCSFLEYRRGGLGAGATQRGGLAAGATARGGLASNSTRRTGGSKFDARDNVIFGYRIRLKEIHAWNHDAV